jgi:hypothetical protein
MIRDLRMRRPYVYSLISREEVGEGLVDDPPSARGRLVAQESLPL